MKLKTSQSQRLFLLFLMLFVVYSCATYAPTVVPSTEEKAMNTDSSGTSIYLIGDAGFVDKGETSKGLMALERKFNHATSKDVLLFLGDNIYPKGMPEKDSGNKRVEAENALKVQLAVAEKFPGKVLFIPGNHDWKSGLDGLKEEENEVERTLGKHSFLPQNGCPLDSYKVSDEIILITIDSEWFLTDWDRFPKINDQCEIKTREKFFEEFKSIVNKNQNKQMIIAIHHPLATYGNHGGQYSFDQMGIPILNLPLNVFRRASGISPQDTNFPLYRELSNRITTLLQAYKDQVIIVSGHDHNLQYLEHKRIPQIISGSGSKVNSVRQFNSPDRYGYAGLGFAVLNIKDNWQGVQFFNAQNELLFTKTIRENSEEKNIPVAFDLSLSSTQKASIYNDDGQKSAVYKWFFGRHYRELYSTEVEFPVVNLDTLYGGMKAVKLGGGNQSVSLRLEDRQGREYVLRRLRKSATQFIQVKAFREEYMKDQLENTVSERFLMDFYTTSYPYAALVAGNLSDIVNIYHTNPSIFYVPSQPILSKYAADLQPDLYLVEERPTKDFRHLASFGNPDDVISTDDMMNLLMKDEKYSINTNQYIKTRLFDMWLGDWDRHEDQYRWAVRENADKTVSFSPIPRDRDQAFPKFDGIFTQAITHLIPSLRLMQSFDKDIKNIKTFNQVIYKTDLMLINQSNLEDWLTAAQFLEKNLTDERIENAFVNLPEALQDKSIENIITNLKERRKHLAIWARDYYKILNKNIIILGTHKDDIFEITRLDNDDTHIKVTRNKSNSEHTTFFEKTYQPEFTKEIWIYGLDDNDHFIVKGDAKKCLQIRIVGGQNKDTYSIENSDGIKIYDYKSKESIFEGKPVDKLLTDDYEINNFDYHKFKHNFRQFLPVVGYNPDEGFVIGSTAHFTLYDFENNPFWQKHTGGVKYFSNTNGFEVFYNNEIAKVVGNYNFALETRYTTPAYSLNFFGYGNETSNLEDTNDIEYLRVRLEQFNAKISILKRGRLGSLTKLSIPVDIVHPNDNDNRFIETVFTPAELESKTFVGAEVAYEFENLNNKAFPTLGIKFLVAVGWKMNVSETNRNFAYLNPSLQLNYPIIKKDVLTLSTLWNGNFINNSNFEFYQAANIGGQNGVRGFRNQRFTGKNAFYQNTDLRWQLFHFNAGLAPAKFGILGGFDYGRVWLDDEDSNKWHNAVGGGVFANASGLFTLQTSYFYSNDGGRFVFGLGLGF